MPRFRILHELLIVTQLVIKFQVFMKREGLSVHMKFRVLKAVKISMLMLWIITSYDPVEIYQCLGRETMFFRNVVYKSTSFSNKTTVDVYKHVHKAPLLVPFLSLMLIRRR